MKEIWQITTHLVVIIVLMAFAFPPLAQADGKDPPTRQLGIALDDHSLEVSFTYKDAITPAIAQKLTSGLPTRIVLQINLERQGVGSPITYWVRTTSIVYDLWEESFIVTVEDGKGRRRAKAKKAEKAVELAATLLKSKVARVKGQPPGNYRLRTVIEVNPVSKEMVANIRRWLSRPSAGSSGSETQSNFFGSFVGVFVDRRIGQADHRITFVSQWFHLGGS